MTEKVTKQKAPVEEKKKPVTEYFPRFPDAPGVLTAAE
jgi:hypothetical protein